MAIQLSLVVIDRATGPRLPSFVRDSDGEVEGGERFVALVLAPDHGEAGHRQQAVDQPVIDLRIVGDLADGDQLELRPELGAAAGRDLR